MALSVVASVGLAWLVLTWLVFVSIGLTLVYRGVGSRGVAWRGVPCLGLAWRDVLYGGLA